MFQTYGSLLKAENKYVLHLWSLIKVDTGNTLVVLLTYLFKFNILAKSHTVGATLLSVFTAKLSAV